MFTIHGKVIMGRRLGRTLGFPTANIRLHKEIPHGIYISQTKLEEVIYPSVTFIGNAVTFNEKKVYVETYLLNFNQDIYNRWISIKLIKKIRNNKKFDDVKSLTTQIKEDIKRTKEYFKNV